MPIPNKFASGRKSLALVGLGALGTEVMLRMLQDEVVLSCLGELLLIDPDEVQAKNAVLSRLYHESFQEHGASVFGSSKAVLAASRLCSLQQARVRAYPSEIADVSWQVLKDLDLVVSCTDNALARVEAILPARSLGIPMLDGGVFGPGDEGGRVTWFPPEPEAACPLCGLSEERRAALLSYASTATLSCAVPEDVALGDSPWITPSLVKTAKLIVHQIRSVFCDDSHAATPESWAMRISVTTRGWHDERVVLRRSLTCPWHDLKSPHLTRIEPDQTFANALDKLRLAFVPRIQFAWPICLVARCRACGEQDCSPRRVAQVRRRGVCLQCGTAGRLEPLRCVSSVGRNEAMAEKTPRQLGWAERQLMQVRPSLVPAPHRSEGR